MTDKQIKINGVDVSECEYCSRYANTTIYHCDWTGECKEHPNCYYKQLKRKEQECEILKKKLDITLRNNINITHLKLDKIDLQSELDQLKIENEKLKDELIEIRWKIEAQDIELNDKEEQLEAKEQECEELRDKNNILKNCLKPFQDKYFKGLETIVIAGLAKKSIRITAENCKLEQVLTEIKEYCVEQNLKADCTACEILQKISEVTDAET